MRAIRESTDTENKYHDDPQDLERDLMDDVGKQPAAADDKSGRISERRYNQNANEGTMCGNPNRVLRQNRKNGRLCSWRELAAGDLRRNSMSAGKIDVVGSPSASRRRIRNFRKRTQREEQLQRLSC